MFDWISHNKEVFLQSHTEIGRSYQHAVELQTQHNHFTMNSMVTNGNHSFGVKSQYCVSQRRCETVTALVTAQSHRRNLLICMSGCILGI